MSVVIKVEKPCLDIGFITEFCCIRVVKEAIALKRLGHRVHLVASEPNSVGIFESIHVYKSPHHLEETLLSMASAIDIWQVHNEPTWPAMMAKEVLPSGSKVILDAHDSNHWRVLSGETQAVIHEDISWFVFDSVMACIDGVVVPSRACAEDVRTRTQAPVAVVPSACSISEYRYADSSFAGGLCSQGGHANPAEIPVGHPENWRDYTELYGLLKGKKQVYAYSPLFALDGVAAIDKHYIGLGAKIGHLRYDQLLDQIGIHSWNLVGNINQAMVWDYALPNKFFDAIAAGLPSVSLNVRMVDEIMAEFDIGISVKTVDEMLERWDGRVEKRKNLLLHRRHLSMENYIPELVSLYRKVLSA
jgi:glycosyltransferase involved in cell wall biosynthesis